MVKVIRTKTPERRSTVFIVNLLLTYFTVFSSVCVDFKQVSVCWVPRYQFENAEITYCRNY